MRAALFSLLLAGCAHGPTIGFWVQWDAKDEPMSFTFSTRVSQERDPRWRCPDPATYGKTPGVPTWLTCDRDDTRPLEL